MRHNTEANKANAIAFYQTAYLGNPSNAVALYVGAQYVQHNPLVGDGKIVEHWNSIQEVPDETSNGNTTH